MFQVIVSWGKAGPANALAGTMTIYQTLLDYFILGQPVSKLELAGLIVGFTGAVVISMGNDIWAKTKETLRL